MISSEPEPINYTYNRQRDLKRFELQDRIRQERQKIILKNDTNEIDNDDLLVTNKLDASFTNENTLGTLSNNRTETRYYQENYVYINISSRQREKYEERPVIAEDKNVFPNKALWDQYWNKETGKFGGENGDSNRGENGDSNRGENGDSNRGENGDIDLCCVVFNNLLNLGQEFPFFFNRDNQLWIRVPKDLNPNRYSVILRPPRRNVRAVRLVSVEGPRNLDVVNEQNNVMLLDVIDPCTCESFHFDDDMPFATLMIPIGSYTVESLLKMIVAILNETVSNELKRLCRPGCEPFTYFYDEGTGQIDILSEFKFHLKFWFSTTTPQFNLWDMLGYDYPYPRDGMNQPLYVNNFTNLVMRPSPLVSGKMNKVPYKLPNLDVYDYVYLVINGMRVIQDEQISLDDDVFAKVLIRENRFLSSTKIYQVALDKLETISVKWLDQFGNLLDMKGQENSFLLEIVEYQDRLKDADYSSHRGLRNFDEEVTRVQYKFMASVS